MIGRLERAIVTQIIYVRVTLDEIAENGSTIIIYNMLKHDWDKLATLMQIRDGWWTK